MQKEEIFEDGIDWMEGAINKARHLLVLWGVEKESVIAMDGDYAIYLALICADRAVARHKEGIDYMPPGK